MTRLSPVLDNKTHSRRPTLPPLASLRLPDIRARSSNMSNSTSPNASNARNGINANGLLPPIPLELNKYSARPRQTSVSSESSSTTAYSSSSRSSSPASGSSPITARPGQSFKDLQRYHPYFHPSRYRVVLSSRFEDADAMLIVPRRYKEAKAQGLKPDPAVLVFGPAAQLLRNPTLRRRLPADIHPYRIVPRHPSDPLYRPAPSVQKPASASSLQTSMDTE
ncbi:hypothetical protein C8Q79DRAFT_1013273 [Trametes meyenii]|nr:hypothetical protein C8Q79DRAFT_1013273 [Trametes meyenii]